MEAERSWSWAISLPLPCQSNVVKGLTGLSSWCTATQSRCKDTTIPLRSTNPSPSKNVKITNKTGILAFNWLNINDVVGAERSRTPSSNAKIQRLVTYQPPTYQHPPYQHPTCMNGNSCSGKRIAVTRQSTTERYTVTALQYKIHFHPQKWQTLRQRKYPANVLILWMLCSSFFFNPQSVIGLNLVGISKGKYHIYQLGMLLIECPS